MGKLIVELPDEIHEAIKRKAALSNKTIREIVISLLNDYLSREGKTEKLQETGFCGKWEDERTAEEIISDIKSHRKWFQQRRKMDA